MRTHVECMVCFMQQALATARLSTDDRELHRLVVRETGRLLSDLDMQLSPPENAVAVYARIARLTGVDDPFARLKTESNTFAMGLRDTVRARIRKAENPLYAAVRYAIAGNIIDYGTHRQFDALQTLSQCIEEKLCIDDFAPLEREIKNSPKNILYLADNCGELVFDGLLVEQLLDLGHRVTVAVRGANILNDATRQSAVAAGIDELCPVISSESSCPGLPLASCGEELRDAFAGAGLVISKGQGNFETLSEARRPIYFLLTVKCGVVAKHIASMKGLEADTMKGSGEFVLMKTEGQNADRTD